MILLEAAFVFGLVGLLAYVVIQLLVRPAERRSESRPAIRRGRWAAVHYDADGATRVVLEKVSEAGSVLDEHVVATIPLDDADYEEKFLTAMAVARQRRAVFEAEEE